MKKNLVLIFALLFSISLFSVFPAFADGQEEEEVPMAAARADEDPYANEGPVKREYTSEDKNNIEAVCRFGSNKFYDLYLAAQSGTTLAASKKKIRAELKRKPLPIPDNPGFADALVDEIYGIYYNYGKMGKKDTRSTMQEGYYRNCMKNILNSNN